MNASAVRHYELSAKSTDTFGRVLCSARGHHFIVDGPIQNGCPGEALTPPELFLSGVAACGVELTQVVAREQGILLTGGSVDVRASLDRSQQPRGDVTLLTSVELRFRFAGVSEAEAAALVAAFKRR